MKNSDSFLDGGMMDHLVYSIAIDFSVTGQILNPFDKQLANLDGSGVVSWEHQGASVTVMSTIMPLARTEDLKSPLRFRNVSYKGLGETTFRIGLRNTKTNLMIRLERDMVLPKNGDPHFKATHINIHQPGSFNHHIILNPLKWLK